MVPRGRRSPNPNHVPGLDHRCRHTRYHPGTWCCKIWRGAAIDRAFDDTPDGRADPLNKADVFQDYARTPATYDQLEHIAQGIDLVASLEALKHANIKDILVRKLKGDLLSGTWPIWQWLNALFPFHHRAYHAV